MRTRHAVVTGIHYFRLVRLLAGKLALATLGRRSLADGAAPGASAGFESLVFREKLKQGLESDRNNSVLHIVEDLT